MKGDTRCIEGRLWRHDPQQDDPYLETEIGACPECEGAGCTAAKIFAKSCEADGEPRWEMCMEHMSPDEYCRRCWAKARADVYSKAKHASDCATHNEPALPNGPCDCGAENAEIVALRRALKSAAGYMRDAGAFMDDFPEITVALNRIPKA